MGKLTDLLKKESQNKVHNATVKLDENILQNVVSQQMVTEPEEQEDTILFDLSAEELAQIKSSVVQIDMNDKNRRQIIIGMFGGIKNPQTGKRFVIPGIDFSTEDYVYSYAKHMQILVNRPNDFKKIMNWE